MDKGKRGKGEGAPAPYSAVYQNSIKRGNLFTRYCSDLHQAFIRKYILLLARLSTDNNKP